MQLHIDTTKCQQSKIWLNDEGRPIHKTLSVGLAGAFLSLASLTEKNLDEWKLRIVLARNLGMLEDLDLSTQDLTDHIGLRLNVPHKQSRQWWRDLTNMVYVQTKHEVEGYVDRTPPEQP